MKSVYGTPSAFRLTVKLCVLVFGLLFTLNFGQTNTKVPVEVIDDLPPRLFVAPSPFTPSCKYEKPGEFHLRNNPDASTWAINGGGCLFRFNVNTGLGNTFEGSLKIFDSHGVTVAEALPDSIGWNNLGNFPDSAIIFFNVYWNGTYSGSGGDVVHEGTYTAQLHFRLPNLTEPIVLQEIFYVKKPSGAKNNTCGTGYSLAFIPALGFKLRRPLKKALLKIFRRPS